jgi:hypothetical protein
MEKGGRVGNRRAALPVVKIESHGRFRVEEVGGFRFAEF